MVCRTTDRAAHPVSDKSDCRDGTFSSTEFHYDPEVAACTCPGGKTLEKYWHQMKTLRDEVSKHGFRR